MPYRRYVYLNFLSNRLAVQLKRLVTWYRANQSIPDSKFYVLGQAQHVLRRHFTELLRYTYRSRVRRDLRGTIQPLTASDVAMLERQVDAKLLDFRRILDDVQ